MPIEASELFKFNDGDSGKVLTFAAGAPDAGDWDVLFVNSNTVVDTPAGFAASEAAVGGQGAYIFTRQAVGGEGATATVNTAGNHDTSVIWVRVSGYDGLDLAESAQINGSFGTASPSFTSSALAEAGELALAFIALHSIGGAPHPTDPVWSAGYTAVLTGTSQGTGGSGVVGFVAAKTPAGTGAESPSATWTNSAADRYILFLTLTAAPVNVDGTITATLPALTGDLDGTATVAGDLDATLPALTGAFVQQAIPGIHTAGGQAGTLTAGGSAGTLTASGQP